MILTVKRKTILAIVLVVFAAVCLSLMFFGANDVAAVLNPQRKIPIYNVRTDAQNVALSFDAAWGADKTRKIMDILDSYGYKGTFFLVGFWIDKFPEMVKEIADRGFLIGNHSINHLHMSRLSKAEVKEEIEGVNKKIKELTGQDVKYFRAPFGEYNNTVVETVEELGMQCIQWDVDSLDWKGLSGGEIASRIVPKAKSGSIILCHNNSDHILDALPIVLEGLKNKGLTPVKMNELVYADGYTIDNNGVQIKA